MPSPPPPEITKLLSAAENGDEAARDNLYQAVYRELMKLSRAHLSRSGTNSLDPPRIVHEVFLRIHDKHDEEAFPNRKVFFAYASSVMRSVIIDYLRERQAVKRGSGLAEITLNTAIADETFAISDIEALNDALLELENTHPRCLRVVEMRYFAGLSEEEIATALDISVPTVQRDWRKARAFLFSQLKNES